MDFEDFSGIFPKKDALTEKKKIQNTQETINFVNFKHLCFRNIHSFLSSINKGNPTGTLKSHRWYSKLTCNFQNLVWIKKKSVHTM